MRVLVLPCLLLLAAELPAASVVSSLPAPERFADGDAAIEITFGEAIDASSLDAHSLRVFGRWSGPATLSLQWLDGDTRLRITPAEPFFAGETVTVRLARTIRDTLGQPLPHGYAFQYWVRSLPATLDFTLLETVPIRRPQDGRVRAYGAFAGDLDDDGDSDLAVPCEDVSDLRVFLNDGFGGYGDFTVIPLLPQGGPSANDGADFDRDGKIDLILGNAFSDRAMLLRGRGDGTFDPYVPYPIAEGVRATAVIDLNGDGCEDVVTASREGDRFATLLGDGSGALLPATVLDSGERGESAVAVGETDGDGLLDVFIGCNESSRLLLYRNDGEGNLVRTASVDAGGRPWVVVSGDFNGDGHSDVASANSYANNCAVAFSDGAGGLSAATTYATGPFPLAIDVGDLDGDGDLDLITSNFFGQDWTLYENDGQGNFVNRRDIPAGTAGSCAILHDRDGDGRLEFTGIDEMDDLIFVFEHGEMPPPPLPQSLRILRAGPNPFTAEAHIDYELTSDGAVEARVVDLRGRVVRRMQTSPRTAGEHQLIWDGRDGDGQPAPSGVYRVQLTLRGAQPSAEITVTRVR